MTLCAARQVADAVLYEGYLLYPYRASSAKNQVRWQFGVLGPPGAAAAGVGEETAMSAELLLTAEPGATVDVHLRFLQVQSRQVQQRVDGRWTDVPELHVAGTRWVPFHEAVSREITLTGLPVAALLAGRELPVGVPGGADVEEVTGPGGVAGRLVRRRWPLAATVTLSLRSGTDERLCTLRVSVHNGSAWSPGGDPGWPDRDVAARSSLVGTHLLLTATGARLVSLLDGPDWAAADAAACVQPRCWPVMVADDAGADAVLVSPIVLGDHPSIAPESAGDLFDATEIDEILTLRVLTLTEQEQADARGTDPRAAAILDRCADLTDEALGRLHGARRPSAATEPELPWWDARADARAEPEQDAVMVAGVPVAKGSRVVLRPSRRADAQDLFLAGRAAVVARVYFDVDGGTHVAVALEDDPGSDLYATTGRFYYFAPEELEPLTAGALPASEDAP